MLNSIVLLPPGITATISCTIIIVSTISVYYSYIIVGVVVLASAQTEYFSCYSTLGIPVL